jgi:IS5 family transposase
VCSNPPRKVSKQSPNTLAPLLTASWVRQRATRHENFLVSQRKRKLIEQGFGWLKTVAGFRKTRYRGVEKNQLMAHFLTPAYNLLRMAKLLSPQPA